MRKIIQIFVEVDGFVTQEYSHDEEGYLVSGDTNSYIRALCDDGTIWRLGEDSEGKKKWHLSEIPQIPQDEVLA
jgi:hypothetical protein